MPYEYDDQARQEAVAHRLVDRTQLQEIAGQCVDLVREYDGDPVGNHSVGYTPSVWGELLPVLPLEARRGRVRRKDVFVVGSAVSSGDRAPRDLLTASYIWGQGRNGYSRRRYDLIVNNNPDLDRRLAKALEVAKEDLIDGYAQLFGGYVQGGGELREAPRGSRWSRIAGFGPAFFTKFLYFTGDHALILDNVVAGRVHELSRLNHLVDDRKRARAWSPYRYCVYLNWMAHTATTVSSAAPSITVTPDLLELALFRSSASAAGEHDAAD